MIGSTTTGLPAAGLLPMAWGAAHLLDSADRGGWTADAQLQHTKKANSGQQGTLEERDRLRVQLMVALHPT
ncbi:hypothetical protein ACFL5O_05095 [Myxococcota bacterium]